MNIEPTSSPPVAPNPNISISNKPTSGYAITALVLGILAIVSCTAWGLPSIVFGPLALMFASMAKRQIQRGEAGASSLGLAKAGQTCGLIGLILGVLMLLFILSMILLPLIIGLLPLIFGVAVQP